jgi:MoxR-like ATPase
MNETFSISDENIQKLTDVSINYSKIILNVIEEIKKNIVGQDDVIKKIMISIISDGHVLLESVPGLAKTLMIKTMADVFSVNNVRIQFTPDLLPADILGTKIYKNNSETFEIQKGPIFHNFVLADEINRAPPKVQSALLEAMQEKQVSIHGETFALEKPFLVLATQNPIENEGTYKLPEAQIDRFALKILIDYPTKDQEIEIIERNTSNLQIKINPIVKLKQILIEFGASPRASIWLIKAAKANAMINGRGYVIPEDVKQVIHEVLRHRLILTFEAEAEEVNSDKVIDIILEKIPSP